MRLTFEHFVNLRISHTGLIIRVVVPFGFHPFTAETPGRNDREIIA